MKTGPHDISLRPPSRPLDRTICLPGSKSLTNRALLIAALAHGTSTLDGILLAADTRCMISALGELGVEVDVDECRRRAAVTGCAGHWPRADMDIDCAGAGTVMRFLTAACATGFGDYRLFGSPRMHERPIGGLIDALRGLGARIGYQEREGFPPIRIMGNRLRGGRITLDASISSQFASALLMAAPLAAGDVFLEVRGELPSRPYVALTLRMMETFGVQTLQDNMSRFIVPAPQPYSAASFTIEPDASAASYFFAAAAVTGGRITVDGLGLESAQGDLKFVDVLEQMGCRVEQGPRHTTVMGPADGALRGVDVDLNDMPDVVQTLAVVAAFAIGPTRIRNVSNLRHKESDRLCALAKELAVIGVRTEIHDDGLTILPEGPITPAAIHTHDDHRMAMSFAIAGLRVDGIVIRGADCVGKTFPEFFELWNEMQT